MVYVGVMTQIYYRRIGVVEKKEILKERMGQNWGNIVLYAVCTLGSLYVIRNLRASPSYQRYDADSSTSDSSESSEDETPPPAPKAQPATA